MEEKRTDNLVEGEELHLKPKMGIIPEVTLQTYETIAKQLKEPVTNSIDANATEIKISIRTDGKYTTLIITDNGDGMSGKDIRDQFLALGGSEKYYLDEKIGRIGIGFMACAPLCERMEIFTRKRGFPAILAEIYADALISRSIHLEEMDTYVVGKVKKIYKTDELEGIEEHFTTISLVNLKEEFVRKLNDKKEYNDLIDQLGKILPLKYPDSCELFNCISEDLKERLIQLATKPSARIFINGEELKKRVYGDEKDDSFDVVMELIDEKAGKARVTGYLVEKSGQIKNWKGLISRYQNVTVEDEGFLGWDKRPSALKRMTGEIFIEGLDKVKAINITRTKFNVGDPNYLAVRDLIHKRITTFVSSAYQRSYISSAIRKDIKKTVTLKKNLKRASKAISKAKEQKTVQKPLVKPTSSKVEKKNLSLQTIDAGKYGDIQVTTGEVKSRPRSGKFEIQWEGEEGIKPKVMIDPTLFRETGEDIELEGQMYKTIFIEDENSLQPCVVDTEKKEILFNKKNSIVKSRDDKILIFLFLLAYYYDKSKDVGEYRKRIQDALTGVF